MTMKQLSGQLSQSVTRVTGVTRLFAAGWFARTYFTARQLSRRQGVG